MSFLLKKVDSLLTSDDLSTKDINPFQDIPKLDVFKDIESEDEEIGDQAAGGTYMQGMGNVRDSDSKVNCLFPPQLIFYLIVNDARVSVTKARCSQCY